MAVAVMFSGAAEGAVEYKDKIEIYRRIKDTLGPAISFSVERLLSLQRLATKDKEHTEAGKVSSLIHSVHYWFYCIPKHTGPLTPPSSLFQGPIIQTLAQLYTWL